LDFRYGYVLYPTASGRRITSTKENLLSLINSSKQKYIWCKHHVLAILQAWNPNNERRQVMVKERKRRKIRKLQPKWNSNSVALRLQCLFPSSLQIGLLLNCIAFPILKQNPTSSGCTVVEWQFLHAPVDTVHQGMAFLPRRPQDRS